jgi:hypothetical protein
MRLRLVYVVVFATSDIGLNMMVLVFAFLHAMKQLHPHEALDSPDRFAYIIIRRYCLILEQQKEKNCIHWLSFWLGFGCAFCLHRMLGGTEDRVRGRGRGLAWCRAGMNGERDGCGGGRGGMVLGEGAREGIAGGLEGAYAYLDDGVEVDLYLWVSLCRPVLRSIIMGELQTNTSNKTKPSCAAPYVCLTLSPVPL